MIRDLLKVSAAVLLLAFLSADICQGQIVYGDPARGDLRMIYQSWKLTYKDVPTQPETTLTQAALPLYVFLPLAEDWELHINTGLSNSHLDGGDAGNSLTSFSTPLLRVYHSFSEDRVFVCAGFSLPGGKKELDSTELPIAELVSEDYLTLPVKQVGNGIGVLLQAGGAQQYERFLFGGSASYFLRGSYTYAAGSPKYNPGDEFTLQGSATLPLEQGRIDLDIGYKYFVADKLGSEDIFKNGDQFSFSLAGGYDFGRTKGELSLLQLIRGKDSRRTGDSFAYEPFNSNGNKTVISAAVTQSFTEAIKGTFQAGYRIVGANDWAQDHPSYFGKSDLFSVGAGVGYTSNDDRYLLYGRLIFHNGSADADAITVSGTEIGFGGRVRL